ncbi:GreA/GreB family elongation factor [Christiangramia echinicola]|uniref:Regulator of nucleoside diphosphate kinase n=1 Tax=Christiangramia echinicola TaxID=279359 RepID=A0A1H1LCF8_9FLAO|nr:GreA/GreB family elongation factor [Christiangramia echinicola]SDR72228.1 regulator of nucleoside diphosphate kinase [Christiangramia echinicola]
MKYRELIIEKKEYDFLKQIISLAKYYKDTSYKASIFKLNEELKDAKIVSNEKMPADVIRLNSLVTIETPYAVERTYQIVTPEKGDIRKDKISVLAPMGLALFGYAQGDNITWTFPLGESHIKIKEVKQVEPELFKVNHDKKHSRTS